MKYRKAREIIDQVAEDLSSYDDQGLIDYSKLYKVIRKCNALLGERINPEKEEMVEIKSFKGYVPEDFSSLNYAFLCHQKEGYVQGIPKGIQVEYETKCTKGTKCAPCLSECDNDYVIYQYLDDNWTQFKTLEVAKASARSFSKCESMCPNLFSRSGNEFEIGPDGSITATFEKGYLYLNYSGSMEDADEDLMVIDHHLVEPYYENEVIRQVLKTVAYNKGADVAQIYADAKIEASRARNQALSFVNQPGYNEIRDLYKAQRNKIHDRFFRPIMGY